MTNCARHGTRLERARAELLCGWVGDTAERYSASRSPRSPTIVLNPLSTTSQQNRRPQQPPLQHRHVIQRKRRGRRGQDTKQARARRKTLRAVDTIEQFINISCRSLAFGRMGGWEKYIARTMPSNKPSGPRRACIQVFGSESERIYDELPRPQGSGRPLRECLQPT